MQSVPAGAQPEPSESAPRLRLLPLLSIEAELTKRLFPELAASVSPTSSEGGSPTAPGVREV